jgi:acylphosphatase
MASTVHLRISGRVQGVGYREALRERAAADGVTGWVRNRRDGSVEAVLQGEAQAVAAVVQWARHGPPAARVTDLVEQPASGDYERVYDRFERLPTA